MAESEKERSEAAEKGHDNHEEPRKDEGRTEADRKQDAENLRGGHK